MNRVLKFIVTKDLKGNTELRFGYVFFHNDLIEKSDKINHIKCVGGGNWSINTTDGTLTLYGSSVDFGAPKKEDIIKAIPTIDWFILQFILEEISEETGDIINDLEDLENYKIVINY